LEHKQRKESYRIFVRPEFYLLALKGGDEICCQQKDTLLDFYGCSVKGQTNKFAKEEFVAHGILSFHFLSVNKKSFAFALITFSYTFLSLNFSPTFAQTKLSFISAALPFSSL